MESDDPRSPPAHGSWATPRCPAAGRIAMCTTGHTPWCPDRREIGCRGPSTAGPRRCWHPDRISSAGRRLRDAVLAEPATTVLGGLYRVGPVGGRRPGHRCRDHRPHRRPGLPARAPVSRGPACGPERRWVSRPSCRARPPRPATDRIPIVCRRRHRVGGHARPQPLANGGVIVPAGGAGRAIDDVDIASVLHKDATLHGVLNYSRADPACWSVARALADGVIDASASTLFPLAEAEGRSPGPTPRRPRPKVMLGWRPEGAEPMLYSRSRPHRAVVRGAVVSGGPIQRRRPGRRVHGPDGAMAGARLLGRRRPFRRDSPCPGGRYRTGALHGRHGCGAARPVTG